MLDWAVTISTVICICSEQTATVICDDMCNNWTETVILLVNRTFKAKYVCQEEKLRI